MPFFAVDGQTLVGDREPLLLNGAGDDPLNPALADLGYRVRIKSAVVGASISKVTLTASTEVDHDPDLAAKFALTDDGGGDFSFSGIVGDPGDPTGIAEALDPTADPTKGVRVYFKLRVRTSEGFEQVFERRFHYRRVPRGAVLSNSREYVSPYPVHVRSSLVDTDFLDNMKDRTGVRRYGGSAEVEIFDDPGAPSPGPFLSGTFKDAPASLTQIQLHDRNVVGDVIPGYAIPPYVNVFGPVDTLSLHFYFLRARFRAISGSPNYSEVPVVLFVDRACGAPNKAKDPADTSGRGPFIPPPDIDGPPIIDPPTLIGGTAWKIELSDPVTAKLSGTYFSASSGWWRVGLYESTAPSVLVAQAAGDFMDFDRVDVDEDDFSPALSSLDPSKTYLLDVCDRSIDRSCSNQVTAPFVGVSSIQVDSFDALTGWALTTTTTPPSGNTEAQVLDTVTKTEGTGSNKVDNDATGTFVFGDVVWDQEYEKTFTSFDLSSASQISIQASLAAGATGFFIAGGNIRLLLKDGSASSSPEVSPGLGGPSGFTANGGFDNFLFDVSLFTGIDLSDVTVVRVVLESFVDPTGFSIDNPFIDINLDDLRYE